MDQVLARQEGGEEDRNDGKFNILAYVTATFLLHFVSLQRFLESKTDEHDLYIMILQCEEHQFKIFREPLPIWSSNTDEERDNAMAKYRPAYEEKVQTKLGVR